MHVAQDIQAAWSRFDMTQCSKHVPLHYGIARCDRSISPRQHSEIKWSRLCTSLIWVQQGREYRVKWRMKDVTTRCGRYIARAIVTTKTRQPSHKGSVRNLTNQLAAICRPSDSRGRWPTDAPLPSAVARLVRPSAKLDSRGPTCNCCVRLINDHSDAEHVGKQSPREHCDCLAIVL